MTTPNTDRPATMDTTPCRRQALWFAIPGVNLSTQRNVMNPITRAGIQATSILMYSIEVTSAEVNEEQSMKRCYLKYHPLQGIEA
jgi:hypothetical protein